MDQGETGFSIKLRTNRIKQTEFRGLGRRWSIAKRARIAAGLALVDAS
jgi:hypothetical protein